LIVDAKVGEPVICTNCNSRQSVPEHAVPATPEEVRQSEQKKSAATRPLRPPQNIRQVHLLVIDIIALVVGWVLVLGGIRCAIYFMTIGAAAGRVEEPVFMMALIYGAFVMSWGLALLYLRHSMRSRCLRPAA
jgi:TRAP-type mannitol/chloroaromatic compound transport system permease large subunit